MAYYATGPVAPVHRGAITTAFGSRIGCEMLYELVSYLEQETRGRVSGARREVPVTVTEMESTVVTDSTRLE